MIAAFASLPPAANCVMIGSFDIAATASAIASMSGVLAGISFVALIMALTGRSTLDKPRIGKPEGAEIDRVLLSLFCATFGLVIATLQFSVLAGESGKSVLEYGRAASEELTADVSLTASILTMLYGLILLVRPRVFGYTSRAMRMISSIIAPGLSMFFICTTAVDVAFGILVGDSVSTGSAGEALVCGKTGFISDAQNLQCILPGAMIVSAITLFWLLPSWRGKRLMQNCSNMLSAACPVVSVALTCTAAAIGGLFNIYNPQSRLTEAQVWTVLGITSAVFLLHAFIMRFGLQMETRQSRPSPASRAGAPR